MNTITSIRSSFNLSENESYLIDNCVRHYSEKNPIKYLFFRIWNAVKSLFNASDWQNAKKILSTHTFALINSKSQSQNSTIELTTLSQIISELALCSMVNKQCSIPERRFQIDTLIISEFKKLKFLPEILGDELCLEGTKLQITQEASGYLTSLFSLLSNNKELIELNKTLDYSWVNEIGMFNTKRVIAKEKIIDFIISKDQTKLDLNHLFLLKLPKIFHISEFKSRLEDLDLSGCFLRVLPPEIGNLSKLKKLNLCFNDLTEIPKEILKLPNDCTINISLAGLSEAKLKELKEIIQNKAYVGPIFEEISLKLEEISLKLEESSLKLEAMKNFILSGKVNDDKAFQEFMINEKL